MAVGPASLDRLDGFLKGVDGTPAQVARSGDEVQGGFLDWLAGKVAHDIADQVFAFDLAGIAQWPPPGDFLAFGAFRGNDAFAALL